MPKQNGHLIIAPSWSRTIKNGEMSMEMRTRKWVKDWVTIEE